MIIRISLIVILSVFSQALGMDCPVGKSIFWPNSCPRVIDESDKSYCCLNSDYETYRCCDVADYASQQGMGLLLIICILIPFIVVIVCCVCCICCPFCIIYKRRHRGAVYGRTPGQVLQNPAPTATVQPAYPAYPSYPPQQQAMPIPTPYAPPPYPTYPQPPSGAAPPYSATTTQEMYPRQAPYNPTYNS